MSFKHKPKNVLFIMQRHLSGYEQLVHKTSVEQCLPKTKKITGAWVQQQPLLLAFHWHFSRPNTFFKGQKNEKQNRDGTDLTYKIFFHTLSILVKGYSLMAGYILAYNILFSKTVHFLFYIYWVDKQKCVTVNQNPGLAKLLKKKSETWKTVYL